MNYLDILACRWCATYCWKDFDGGYKFALDLILIRGLKKIMGLQRCGNPHFRNFETPKLGVPR